MLSCKEVTQLVSESLDRDLHIHQRMAMWIHIFMCKYCSRYRRQLMKLRDVIGRHSLHSEDIEFDGACLSPEARKRIKQSLNH
jgi:hypothetical protein